MKKLLTLAAVFSLVFTTCKQPANNDNSGGRLPNLTIRNESSFVLTNVTFSGISFSTSGSDLLVSSQSVKQLTANDINKGGYITFTRKDIGIACRTEAIAISNEDYTFTFLDTTVVEEIANSGNKKSLAQITFVSKVTVEMGGLVVPRNDIIDMEGIVNFTRQTEFTLKNTGVGKLLLTGTQPVKITGTGTDAFSVVQPSSSEIAPNGSLTFRINFAPGAIQNYNATVTISSNDQDGDFTFTIRARGVPSKPIVSVYYENNEIAQNGTINAGAVSITQSKNITVIIKNIGTEVLIVDTASITITGADAEAFVKITNPGGNISAGEQSSFIIECTPSKQGESHAILTIPTNDSSRNNIVIYLRIEVVLSFVVSYDINHGSGTTPVEQTANAGSSITLPNGNGFTRSGYAFLGWNTNASGTGTNYSAGSSYTVTGSITLYAKWDEPIDVPEATLAAKLSWLESNTQSNNNYVIEVNANESIGPTSFYFYYSGKENISIILKGTGTVRNVNLSSNGTLFTVGNSVTLILDNNITLRGRSSNSTPLVRIREGGTLVMNEGSCITGNSSSSSSQTTGFGSGVYVDDNGTFIMNGGTISNNVSSGTSGSGGGVYVSGTFTMSGGTISSNTASRYGGGVHVAYGTFTMSGGTISGNTASYGGGGVSAGYDGTFILNNGTISSNTSDGNGGGVCAGSNGTFTMNGGTISGNTASISGGGGVKVETTGTFTKTGGTIYGYNASDTVNSNVIKNSSGTVANNYGHAVHAYAGSPHITKRRETTAGLSDNLSFNGNDGTFSGIWD